MVSLLGVLLGWYACSGFCWAGKPVELMVLFRLMSPQSKPPLPHVLIERNVLVVVSKSTLADPAYIHTTPAQHNVAPAAAAAAIVLTSLVAAHELSKVI